MTASTTRPIKFKAKRLGDGIWIEGDLVHIGNRVCIGGDHIQGGINDVDPLTVCQFTGEKDSAGNEIFEWDELECVCEDGRTLRGYVEYALGMFTLDYNGIFNLGYLVGERNQKIVGNKFDKKINKITHGQEESYNND